MLAEVVFTSAKQQHSHFTTDAPITSALSTSNLSIGSTTTTTASLNTYFSNVEEGLNKKLDNEIDQFVVSFHDIVKGSGIHESIRVPGRDTDKSVEKDKYKNALDGLVDELCAANMVQCCEGLLNKNKVLQLNKAVTQAIWEMESVLREGGSNQQLDPSKM
ncbi:3022_t:CDS:2 [Entrophospora sp. SA101]|nr:3022_t:CDS:2 [Entrophospora sp. SA101]